MDWLKAHQLAINNNMVTKLTLHKQAKIQLVRTVHKHESKILDNIVKSSTLSDPWAMLPLVHTVDNLNPQKGFCLLISLQNCH